MRLDKIVDKRKLVIRLWLSLWIILFLLVFFKVCFNIWYPIVIENEYLLKMGDFIDNNIYLKYSIIIIFYLLNSTLFYLTATINKIWKHKITFFLLEIITMAIYIIKITNNTLGSILEVISLLTFSICFNLIKNKNITKLRSILLPIILYIIINLWQLNILFVRELYNNLNSIPFIISFVLQIDYYVFMVITWIGVVYMGMWGIGWLWGKDITELKAMKEKELAKKEPDKELIAQIDKAIIKKENE